MKLKENRRDPILIKFGRSEHKRENILNFYLGAAESISELENENIKIENVKTIQKCFENNGVLKNKTEININRELSAFEKDFPLFKKNNDKFIIKTNLTKNILKYKDKKIFIGKSYIELAILTYLIKKKSYNKYPFLEAIKLAKTEKYLKKEFIDKIYKLNRDEIKIKFDDKYLMKLLKYGSGSKNKELQNLRDEYFNSIIKLVCEFKNKINIDNNIDNLLDNFLKYEFKIKDLNKKEATGILIFFNWNKDEIKDFLIKKNKNAYFWKIKNELNNSNWEDKFIDFIYKKSENDYKNLLQKYLFFTGFFILDKNKIKLNKNYKNFINELIEKYDKLLKLNISTDEIFLFFKKEFINIEYLENEKYYSNITKIINEFYDTNFFNKFCSILDYKNPNLGMGKISNENNHINSIINGPTFFEYIINILFFKIFYKEEIHKGINLNKIFIKSLNTKFTNEFIPIRFASGNKSDSIFKLKEKIIIIEPTLEYKNQMKQELQSIINHKQKEKASIAILVSPKINEIFLEVLKILKKKEKYSIIPFSKKEIKILINSDFDIKEFFKLIENFENKSK